MSGKIAWAGTCAARDLLAEANLPICCILGHEERTVCHPNTGAVPVVIAGVAGGTVAGVIGADSLPVARSMTGGRRFWIFCTSLGCVTRMWRVGMVRGALRLAIGFYWFLLVSFRRRAGNVVVGGKMWHHTAVQKKCNWELSFELPKPSQRVDL